MTGRSAPASSPQAFSKTKCLLFREIVFTPVDVQVQSNNKSKCKSNLHRARDKSTTAVAARTQSKRRHHQFAPLAKNTGPTTRWVLQMVAHGLYAVRHAKLHAETQVDPRLGGNLAAYRADCLVSTVT